MPEPSNSNRMKCTVTVITPALNTESFIGQAIDSVLAQTHCPSEYLVVDTGSIDRTVEVIYQHLGGADFAKLIQTQVTGSGAARNRGLERATGDYIAFLDADDLWEPNMLERCLALIEQAGTEVKGVFCHSLLILSNGAVVGRLTPREGPYGLEDLLVGGCPPGNGSCLLLRRECFDELGGFDETMDSAVDFEMWSRIAAQGGSSSFICLPEPLVQYRLHSGSVSGSLSTRLASPARLAGLEEILRRYGSLLNSQEGRARSFIAPAVFAFRGGDEERSKRWSREALGLGLAPLLHDAMGRRMLGWLCAGAPGRRAVRFARRWLINIAVELVRLPLLAKIVARVRG